MAKERASIVAHALDDARIELTPSRAAREVVGALRAFSDKLDAPGDPLPAPSARPVDFMYVPLGGQPATGSAMLESFASLRPAAKRERMVPYPIRLPAAQIAELERLREKRGIIPAEFIRDAVASCLALLREA